MPSTSPKQARTMAAAAHNPKFRKKLGIPKGVAEDFNDADKGTGMLSEATKASPTKGQIDTTTKKKVFKTKPKGNQFGLKKEKHYGR